MVCRPFRASGVQADEAYIRRMTGEGGGVKEQQRERVLFPECRKDLDKGSLLMNRQTQHRVVKGGLGSEGEKADGVNDPRTCRLAFPGRAGPRPFPVEGCSGRASTRTAMVLLGGSLRLDTYPNPA